MTAPMQAGPELDAVVSERVFGWVPLRGESAQKHNAKDLPASRAHIECIWVRRGKRMACQECGDMPSWSTDIAAGWPVFQHMMDQRFSVRSRFFQALTDEAKRISDGLEVPSPWILQTLCHDFPAAVCRAALAAVERPGAAHRARGDS